MNRLDKAGLMKLAPKYFKSHPSVDTFYATEDGMFFTAANKLHAQNHAASAKVKLHEISRPVESAPDPEPAGKAPAKKAPAKEAPAKKAPAKEAPAKEAPAKEAPAKE